MSNGDREQLRHDKVAALRLRLAALDEGEPTFQQFHQTGVLLSALADSAWWIGGRHWQKHANRLLSKANEMFGSARLHLPANDNVAHAGLMADRAMWAVRMWRSHEGTTHYQQTAEECLELARQKLAHWTQDGLTANPDAWHQMGIVHMLDSQVAWGKVFGYGNKVDAHRARRSEEQAKRFFGQERALTLDGERAYRSFLLTSALAHGIYGDRGQQHYHALLAFKSAKRHGDRPHRARAAAIIAAGRQGERLLRLMQDGKTVRTPL